MSTSWASLAEISISELSKRVSFAEIGPSPYIRSGTHASNCGEVSWVGIEVDSDRALFRLKTNPSPWSESSSSWTTGRGLGGSGSAKLGVVSSGSIACEISFLPFFPAPLPFPLPFPASKGLPLAVLPIRLKGLMGGAISDTWPEGIRSGMSLSGSVVARGATNNTVGSTRTSWDRVTIGPSRNDPIWDSYLKRNGVEWGWFFLST